MYRIIGTILAISSILNIVGCKRAMTNEEASSFILEPKNGYIQTATTESINYTLIYKPTELLFPSEVLAQSEGMQKNPMYYFQLNMSTLDNKEIVNLIKSKDDYNKLIYTLNEGLNNKIMLLSNLGDTILPIGVQYSNFFNHSKSTTVLMVFQGERISLSKKFTIRISDIEPVDYTSVYFTYNFEKLKKFPKIKR